MTTVTYLTGTELDPVIPAKAGIQNRPRTNNQKLGSNHQPRATYHSIVPNMKKALNPILRGAQLLFAVLLIVFATAKLLLLSVWRDNPGMELFLCRHLLICDTDRLRERAQTKLKEGEPEKVASAILDLQEAVRRDPASANSWCELGEALLESGQLDEAKAAMNRAVELAPKTPPVLLRDFNLLVRLQEIREALPLAARILALVPDYDDYLFGSFTRWGMPIAEVLELGLPTDVRGVHAYARFLARSQDAERLDPLWTWMSSRFPPDRKLVYSYLQFLINKRRFDDAKEATISYLGRRREDVSGANLISNAEFSSDLEGNPLDWQIREVYGGQAKLVRGGEKSGRVLRIEFDGKENVNFSHVSQTLLAEPGRYEFSAHVKTENLTTDQGVSFRFTDQEDSKRFDTSTIQSTGSSDWHVLKQTLTLPEGSRLIQIQLVRKPTIKFDNKISGVFEVTRLVLQKSESR
ncbi:MAG TPA: tetratricopeptide repeat protein [Terriglobia bacterium]|nr:tetratricopeptide repeat protein [Terriglobia bacterium]